MHTVKQNELSKPTEFAHKTSLEPDPGLVTIIYMYVYITYTYIHTYNNNN